MTINPFTLKELRSLTRSRAISGTLVAFLVACLGVSYFVPILSGIDQHTGVKCFACIMFALGLALAVILPVNVYSRLMRERGGAKKSAPDFALLTALPPSEIIDGKLRAAMALMTLFAASAAPFAVFAYLLHGITFAEMAVALALVISYSAVAVHLMLAIAAMKVPRALRIVLATVAIFSITASIMPASSLIFIEPDLSDLPLYLAYALTACLILRGGAIAFLSPIVMDRDRPLRITITLLIFAWAAYILVLGIVKEPSSAIEPLTAYTFFTALLAVMLGAYAAAQPANRSRRMIAARPSSRAKRFFSLPFAPGAASAFLFSFLVALVPALAAPLALGYLNSTAATADSACCADMPFGPEIASILFYSFAILLAVRFIWRLLAVRTDGRTPRTSPIIVPIVSLTVFIVLQSVPSLLEVSGSPLEDPARFPFVYDSVEAQWHLCASLIAFSSALTALALLAAAQSARRGHRLAASSAASSPSNTFTENTSQPSPE